MLHAHLQRDEDSNSEDILALLMVADRKQAPKRISMYICRTWSSSGINRSKVGCNN